jgi:nitronate monooxygenase
MPQLLAPLKIGSHTVSSPVLQGAMAVRVSGGNLAAAVANAGGVGVISALGLGLANSQFAAHPRPSQFFQANQQALIDELQKARTLSPKGILGVNILVATKDYAVLAQTAAAHGANLIIVGAGLPLDLPSYTAAYPNVALVPMVCGLEAVQTICQGWQQRYRRLPDALIVENSEAVGGHIGSSCADSNSRIATLLPQIRRYLQEIGAEIPLIAAGGIWDRADLDRMLALGASGVQVGTRFITTEECDADPRYKQRHLEARPEDVVIVPSPVGKPARALRNAFAEKAMVRSPELDQRCIANCLESCLCRDQRQTYCILQALAAAARGDAENGLIFSGANVGRAERLMSVAEVMTQLTGT